MSTPTIEIEASLQIELALCTAIRVMVKALNTATETAPELFEDLTEIKELLADVVRARSLAKRYDEQQIRLPLPR